MQEVIDQIKTNVRSNSENIHKIKTEVKPHISPKSDRWLEYVGRKYEVTKSIVALHILRNEPHKISSHTKNAEVIRDAKRLIRRLTEKFEKGVTA